MPLLPSQSHANERNTVGRHTVTPDEFIKHTARSIRLYQRGILTAQEFTNVTIEDMRRLESCEDCGGRFVRGSHVCFGSTTVTEAIEGERDNDQMD